MLLMLSSSYPGLVLFVLEEVCREALCLNYVAASVLTGSDTKFNELIFLQLVYILAMPKSCYIDVLISMHVL